VIEPKIGDSMYSEERDSKGRSDFELVEDNCFIAINRLIITNQFHQAQLEKINSRVKSFRSSSLAVQRKGREVTTDGKIRAKSDARVSEKPNIFQCKFDYPFVRQRKYPRYKIRSQYKYLSLAHRSSA